MADVSVTTADGAPSHDSLALLSDQSREEGAQLVYKAVHVPVAVWLRGRTSIDPKKHLWKKHLFS